MSTIQLRNSANAITVDSDNKAAHYRDHVSYSTISDKGYYVIPNKLGGTGDMGFSLQGYKADDNLQWFRFNNNAKAFFAINQYLGGGLVTQNAGVMARTHFALPVAKGYINIWNAKGELIWSDAQAAKIPRILGFITIPPNFDLDNNVYQQNIGLDKFILTNMCPAELSDDGTVAGWSGLFFRMVNGTIQVQWVRKNQKSWAETFKATGMKIPYAIFPNL